MSEPIKSLSDNDQKDAAFHTLVQHARRALDNGKPSPSPPTEFSALRFVLWNSFAFLLPLPLAVTMYLFVPPSLSPNATHFVLALPFIVFLTLGALIKTNKNLADGVRSAASFFIIGSALWLALVLLAIPVVIVLFFALTR